MSSNTDWGKGGAEGFLRDPNNEQVATLPAGGIFTGQWTRIDKAKSILLLYGTHVEYGVKFNAGLTVVQTLIDDYTVVFD